MSKEQREELEVLASPNWYLGYYVNGKQLRECSESPNKKVAEALLVKRLNEIRVESFAGLAVKKLTVADLYEGLLQDYRVNELASLDGAEQRWRLRLNPAFGHMRASQLTTDALNRFIEKYQDEGLSNGTLNRDMAALKRAYNLALKARKVQHVPVFPHLKEAPPRKGFVEQTQYDELRKCAKELWMRALLAVAYAFGFRSGELMEMRVNQIDLAANSIRLWRGETKSGEPRLVKMTNEVSILLAACVQGKKTDDYVFTRKSGKPVADFRGTWKVLCEEAGVPGLLFHDLRRSAVRNMIRQGVPETVAMSISGHKTRSIFDRYNVVSERDLDDAARKIESAQNKHKSNIIEGFPQQTAKEQLPV
jgi:integrase